MTEYNFIGDVHGRYRTLQALLAKMPAGAIPFSVGDMIDRGPESKKVLEFFYEKGQAVLGNHEHLMLDWIESEGLGRYYGFQLWGTRINGAAETIRSFDLDMTDLSNFMIMKANARLLYADNSELFYWLKNLPFHFENEELIVTHAPLNPTLSLDQCLDIGDECGIIQCGRSVLWNTGRPRRKDRFQIHGHFANKKAGVLRDKDGVFGINLDSSRGEVLSGMHWPSKEIFTQDFLD